MNIDKISAREIQVLKLAATGLRHKEIADKLHIGNRTVETHLKKIYHKLGCNNIFQALICMGALDLSKLP